MPAMMTQDQIREWITAKLAERGHGARMELAKHLGLQRPDAITRMLNRSPGKETREIKASEWEAIKAFFQEDPERASDAPEVRDLLEAFRQLDPSLRQVAIQQIRALTDAKS